VADIYITCSCFCFGKRCEWSDDKASKRKCQPDLLLAVRAKGTVGIANIWLGLC